ncbi:MAG: DUF177 domain-containing protein [Acidobacteria bacterium]|nr:DUF177 domain-containing protein [Acidobacteriota bacterium]
MIIELASVQVSPKKIEEKFAPDEIHLEGEGRLIGQAAVSGKVFRDGDKVHVSGAISANVELACTRCLEPVEHHLDIAFDDVFVEAASETRDEETELSPDAMNESLVVGGKVDLAETVREQIILELPDPVLCSEDCKGLCPKCGENRNLIDCKCESDDIDPRWAALKNLN